MTALLSAWSDGQRDAGDRLMELVYSELRQIAERYLRAERVDHTLQPTALVHEAYIRLLQQEDVDWRNRAHFFGLAASMMRRILIDHARSHRYAKRGGDQPTIHLGHNEPLDFGRPDNLIALDEALEALAKIDPRKAQIVEMRFFGGLEVQQIAGVLEVSIPTVNRHWRSARAWLYRYLRPNAEAQD